MTLSSEAQQYISQELQVLEDVLESLRTQLIAAEQKLATEQVRARELTSEMVASYREEEKQMLASDEAVSHALTHKKSAEIKALRELINNPYFARLVIEEEVNDRMVTREYRLGTHANPDCRIVDWRHAPISKLFYEYQEGDEFCEEIQGVERYGSIIERSSVFIEEGKLVQLQSGMGTFCLVNGSWELRDQASSSYGRSGYGSLPSIMALVTETQFHAITNEPTEPVLIEGVAGSGKTTVALYRLSWLLEQKELALAQKDCIVVVKSPVLKTYIQKSLPSLSIHGVEVVTFNDWCHKVVAKYCSFSQGPLAKVRLTDDTVPLERKALLHSKNFLLRLEQVELERRDKVAERLTKELTWDRVPSGIAQIFEQERYKQRSAEALLARLLHSCKQAQQKIAPSHQLYAGLIELTQYLSTSMQSLPAVPQRIYEVLHACDQTFPLSSSDSHESFEVPRDFAPAILKVLQIQGRKLVRPSGESGSYRHTIIDEAQDLSPLEFSIVADATTDGRQLTVVGDRAQKVSLDQFESAYDLLESSWGDARRLNDVVKLEVSYRSTQQIIELADIIKGKTSQGTGREGARARLYQCYSEEAGLEQAQNWLNEQLTQAPLVPVAVLCADPSARKLVSTLLRPSFGHSLCQLSDNNTEFDTGVVVSDIVTAKGLEFPAVLIWDTSANTFPKTTLARNLLHIAVTRAEDSLALINWSKPCSYLPVVNTKLLDLYEIEPEPEEEPLPSI